MLKTNAFFALFCLFLASPLLAQNQPSGRFPEFIYLNETEALLEKSNTVSLFQKYYKLKPADALRPVSSKLDAYGTRLEKYQQFYKGVKVDNATSTVHYKNGKAFLLTGNIASIDNLNVKPTVSAQKAFAEAIAHVGAKRYMWEEPEAARDGYEKPQGDLVVWADLTGNGAAKLAYRYDIYAIDSLYRAYVYIDAQSGKFIQEIPRIHHTNQPSTGVSQYNGTVNFTADSYSGNYRLRQTVSGGGVETYTLGGSYSHGSATDITSAGTHFTGDQAGVQAHWSAEKVHEYFMQHGRNSYDDAGAVLKSYVHYGVSYFNAFWDGTRMTYGDGTGSPLVTLDICGHEISHGVTEFSAGLIYANESGALNESFSDIFGEAVEHYATGSNNWLMGSEIGIVIRTMSNPNASGDPDTYLGTNWYTGSGDFGGVHTNSGVQNFWFYLLTVGGTGTNDLGNSYCVNGLGIQNAARIAYRNLTVYLSASSNYAAARAGAIQSARDLFGIGSEEEIATTNAWYAVGVGGPYVVPVSIACPVNITVPNAPGLCSAPVSFPPPVAHATCPSVTQITGLPSGASFPVGITINTFKVTDALGGASATCSFTVKVNDTEKPNITCPANLILNCGASTDPSMTGNPAVTDNCGIGTVTYIDATATGSCPGNKTITRTWKALDVNSNDKTCAQVINVQDVTPPAIICPADITVTCKTEVTATGQPTVNDYCDAAPQVWHSDYTSSGDCEWLCTIERSWFAKDNCGNSNKCVQVITKSVLPLIEDALSKDVDGDGNPDMLVMGHSNSTITLPPGTGNCVLKYLPYAGGMAPSGLKFSKVVVGADCLPGTNPVDLNLRLKNPLLGEALKMTLVARVQPNVGKTLLSAYNCSIHPVVLQALAPNPTVNELLRVTNLTLGNINFGTAAHKQYLLDALQCINAQLNICNPPVPALR